MQTYAKFLKPIFHCDAKPSALGTGVGLDPQRHTVALPNAKEHVGIFCVEKYRKSCFLPGGSLVFSENY